MNSENKRKFIKNIEHSAILSFENLLSYNKGQIVSMTLAQNQHVSMTLFAFDQDEEISSHESEGDALIMVLDGQGEITIAGKQYVLNKGDSIVMPAQQAHAVKALTQFKMMLIVVFPA